MKINVYKDHHKLSDYEMANIFKSLGYDRHLAWDMYIKWLDLKPRIDAKEFMCIYDQSPGNWKQPTKDIDFIPTHYDNLCKQRVQIERDQSGVYNMVWEDGTTGTNPPVCPPEAPRYVAIAADMRERMEAS